MGDYRIVVTDDRHGSYAEENRVLAPLGVEVDVLSLESESEGIDALGDADAILLNLFPMSDRVIRELRRCKVISRYGTGYDNVDVEAATRAGIWVARVPDYAEEDASDHALALLLACIRQISARDRSVRTGGWNVSVPAPVSRIAGKVLGIAGFGHVGRALCRKVSGFPLSRVLVYDPHKSDEMVAEHGAVHVSMEQFLEESDYISLHVPLNDSTRHMIGQREIDRMKDGVVLVNTARGAVVDEDAATDALEKGKIASAGLDVFETEPLAKESRLRDLPNVVLTDHAGYYSVESIVELKTKAALNVLRVLTGEPPIYPVNLVHAKGSARNATPAGAGK